MPIDLGETMQSLYRQFGDLPGITVELHRELPAIRVENDRATATVFLQGAQLAHYQHHNQPPLIWCSPLCDYRRGVPLRGGIPVCWPWFGDPEKNPEPVRRQLPPGELPAHGLVRNRDWQLDSVNQPGSDLTELVFSLALPTNGEPAWPHATPLTLTVRIGDRLDVSLDVLNNSDRPVVFSGALHSYFAVSDIDQVSLEGLYELNYIDCLQGWSQQQQRGSLTIDREVDRIYHGTAQPITLVDRGWQRAIEVDSEGSDSAVVWNPWIDKSRRLSQFADDDYREMLCIETANADRNFVQLQPAQRHRLSVGICSRPLN